jgi:hypothetical protein
MADNLPPSSTDVTESGSPNLPEHSGPHRPVMGVPYLFFTFYRVAWTKPHCLEKAPSLRSIIISLHVSFIGMTVSSVFSCFYASYVDHAFTCPSSAKRQTRMHFPIMTSLYSGDSFLSFDSRPMSVMFVFSNTSRPALEPTPPSMQWVLGSFSGITADYPPLFGGKQCVELYLHPPGMLPWDGNWVNTETSLQ